MASASASSKADSPTPIRQSIPPRARAARALNARCPIKIGRAKFSCEISCPVDRVTLDRRHSIKAGCDHGSPSRPAPPPDPQGHQRDSKTEPGRFDPANAVRQGHHQRKQPGQRRIDVLPADGVRFANYDARREFDGMIHVRHRPRIEDLLNPAEVERALQSKRQGFARRPELSFQNHTPYRKSGRVEE